MNIFTLGERMQVNLRSSLVLSAWAILIVAAAQPAIAQLGNDNPSAGEVSLGTDELLPSAPLPQLALAAAETLDAQAQQGQNQTQQPQQGQNQTQQPQNSGSAPTPNAAPQQSSGSTATPAPNAGQTEQQKAQQQVKEEEKQRVLGVVPNFNTSYRFDAVSLTPKQKLALAFRSAVDPATFGIAFIVSGLHEALDDDTGFRWGIEGYGRRTGAAYLDAFDGTMIGNGFLPIVFRQDPRYFRLGHGTATHRLLYAMSTSFICRHDKTGKWEPNYSNVLGNIASGALSNLYYPDQNSGFGLTISNGFIVTGEGMAGGVFAEFWPDISRRVFHKDPTHGVDAQARQQDAAEKAARQAAKQKQQPQQNQQQSPQ
jgi:hypothetical protein